MGKRVSTILPDGRQISIYVSNNSKARKEAAKRLSQQYGYEFDEKTLKALARKERRYDEARQAYLKAANASRPAWAKNIVNWADLSPMAKQNAQKRYEAKQAQLRALTSQKKPDTGIILKTPEKTYEQRRAEAAQKRYQTEKASLIKSAQEDLKARFGAYFESKKPVKAIQVTKTGFEKRVERVSKREQGIAKRMQQLEEVFDISNYFGTAKTKAGRYAQKFASEALSLPTKFTVGAVDFLELAAEKGTAAVEGLVRSRKDTTKELARAAKETPKEVIKTFDIRDPATAAQLVGMIALGARGGKTKTIKKPLKLTGKGKVEIKSGKIVKPKISIKAKVGKAVKLAKSPKKAAYTLKRKLGYEYTKDGFSNVKLQKQLTKLKVNIKSSKAYKTLRKAGVKAKTAANRIKTELRYQTQKKGKPLTRAEILKLTRKKLTRRDRFDKPSFQKKYGKRAKKITRKQYREIAKKQLRKQRAAKEELLRGIRKNIKIEYKNKYFRRGSDILPITEKAIVFENVLLEPGAREGITVRYKGKLPAKIRNNPLLLKEIKKIEARKIAEKNRLANQRKKSFRGVKNQYFRVTDDLGKVIYETKSFKLFRKTQIELLRRAGELPTRKGSRAAKALKRFKGKKGQARLKLERPEIKTKKPGIKGKETLIGDLIKAAERERGKNLLTTKPRFKGRIRPFTYNPPELGDKALIINRPAYSETLKGGQVSRQIIKPKPKAKTKPKPKAKTKPKPATVQKPKTKSTTAQYLTSSAITAAALEIQRRAGKKTKGRQSNQRFDMGFNKYINLAKKAKKGIYIPDLYAVLNNEKASASQKVKYMNPDRVFSGFEARPILG